MSRSKSARTTSPGESFSTETRNNASDKVCIDPITIFMFDGTELDLVVGQIYHDFSGEEKKCWYKFQNLGDNIVRLIPGGGFLAPSRVANNFGSSLLFLGHRNGQKFDEIQQNVPTNTYLYFLSKSQIVGVVCEYEKPILDKFIQLWPHDEKLIHKSVYYFKNKKT